jgi:hypothetical protein
MEPAITFSREERSFLYRGPYPVRSQEFRESLERLVAQGYRHDDIGVMFGVSQEVVKNWCAKQAIPVKRGRSRLRVWYPTLSCFIPIGSAARNRLMVVERARNRSVRIAKRRLCITKALVQFLELNGRQPTAAELYIAAFGRAPIVRTSHWGAPYLCHAWAGGRVKKYDRVLREIYGSAGVSPRAPNGSGAVKKTGRKPREVAA